MEPKHVYEYALIRVMPRVERGEFVNAGVVLYCKNLKFLQSKIELNRQRLLALFPDADLMEIEQHLDAFRNICSGKKESGSIALLDMPSRFRWLTAKRSTIIQASELHPGLCTDAEATLVQLFEKMVL